jgi:S-adenosylmethionine:tRNA ribosyltransferase-isomerase
MAVPPPIEIPDHLIAQHPLPERDQARMLVLQRGSGTLQHHHFHELPALLPPESLLVVNNTRVLPYRLPGRLPSGGAIEALLVTRVQDGQWEAMVRRARRLRPGLRLDFCKGALPATAVRPTEEGRWLLCFDDPATVEQRLEQHGLAPLPPYIRRDAAQAGAQRETDRAAYQTIFARVNGAVAAPTAGLHFTPRVRQALAERGMEEVPVTLHVGLGTFKPMETEDPALHVMHEEWYDVPAESAHRILTAKGAGRPVIAVGTTSVRVLETWAQRGCPAGDSGWTRLYIREPYTFRVVDGMITNFHQPRSTLLLLVTAFAGRLPLIRAYDAAVAAGYRFFSFGDCMLILPGEPPTEGA